DPGGRGHWPSGGTGLVGQDDAITGLGVPVGIGAGGLEAVRAWGHDLTVLVHHLGIGEFVLFGIGVLGIANRALGLGGVVGNALVALGAEPTRPLDRVVGSNLGLPVGADLGQIIGEIVGRARAVRAMHEGNRLVGQLGIWIEFLQRRIVPGLHLAQENLG